MDILHFATRDARKASAIPIILEREHLELVAILRTSRPHAVPPFLVRDAMGRKFVFHVHIAPEPWKVANHRAEEAILSDSRLSSIKGLDIPRILKSGFENSIYWSLRDYIEGETLGWMDENFGFPTDFLRNHSPADLATILFSIQKITPDTSVIPQRTSEWYRADLEYRRQILSLDKNAIIPEHSLGAMHELLDKEKLLIDTHSIFLNHGDLYPNNIIVTDGKIAFIDWEWTHLNLPTCDASLVWLLSWREPQWQQQFIDHLLEYYEDRHMFRTSFRITSMNLAIRLISDFPRDLTRLPVEELKAAREAKRHCEQMLAQLISDKL